MATLSNLLKAGALYGFVTSAESLFEGIRSVERMSPSETIPVETTAYIWADSQFRFLGMVWGGYSAMLWWASNDLETRQAPLAILGVTAFLGGIGRALSAAKYGFGTKMAVWATLTELLGPLLIWRFGGW